MFHVRQLITLHKAETRQVIPILAEITGMKFEPSPMDQGWWRNCEISYTNTHDMRADEVIRSLETVLHEQAV